MDDATATTLRQRRSRASHGWSHIDATRKRELIEAIISGRPTPGPSHAELNITDRCNVACYFCNQQDIRTSEQLCFERCVEILNELIGTGLRSVRFSGGGDPLFHPDIVRILDYLGSRGIVVDNITTNGVGLTEAVAERLVRDNCREVIISLNAADAADYSRMMAVRPDRFDLIVENVRRLIALRGDRGSPSVVVQFLLDRNNYHRLLDMYRLGRSIGADAIAVGLVLEIPLNRIDRSCLLTEADAELLRRHLAAILREDQDASLLEIHLGIPALNLLVQALRTELNANASAVNNIATAPSFSDENGACFFGWYSTVIRGNGDLHACCFMQNPEVKPLGNVRDGTFAHEWNGPAYSRLREEMREVFLTGGQISYNRARFKRLEPFCVEANRCGLKNLYFRGDEEFYRDLRTALERVRSREVTWFGSPKQILRAAEVFIFRHRWAKETFDWLRNRSRPIRHWLRPRPALMPLKTRRRRAPVTSGGVRPG